MQFCILQKLFSFDFSDEVFKVIELPNARIVGTNSEHWVNIWVLNDSIALISFPLEVNDKCFEVLLMNEEFDGGRPGGQMSWNKFVTVEMPHSNLCPLTGFANGDVFLQDDKLELHLYNSVTEVIKNLGIEFEDSDEL